MLEVVFRHWFGMYAFINHANTLTYTDSSFWKKKCLNVSAVVQAVYIRSIRKWFEHDFASNNWVSFSSSLSSIVAKKRNITSKYDSTFAKFTAVMREQQRFAPISISKWTNEVEILNEFIWKFAARFNQICFFKWAQRVYFLPSAVQTHSTRFILRHQRNEHFVIWVRCEFGMIFFSVLFFLEWIRNDCFVEWCVCYSFCDGWLWCWCC